MTTPATRRRAARIGTGILALALFAPAAGPAVSIAADPGEELETENEGPSEAGPGEPDELTPGQESTDDIVEENSAPLLSPGDRSDPDEGENEDGPVENESQVQQQEGGGEPASGAPAPPAVAPSPPAPAVPPSAGTSPAPQVANPVSAPRSRVAPVRRPSNGSSADRSRIGRRPSPVRGVSGATRPVSAPKAPVPRPVTSPEVAPDSAEALSRGKNSAATYTVRAGDSLWSIASARLGPGATAARVAREVQRLWDLNERAIGTGDPSLLGVGVPLRLR